MQVIEVHGATLILGGPHGAGADQLGAFGSSPFVQASGTAMVLVEAGNTFAKFAPDCTFQTAGSTDNQLTSSAPSDVLGQPVTYTATCDVWRLVVLFRKIESDPGTNSRFLDSPSMNRTRRGLLVPMRLRPDDSDRSAMAESLLQKIPPRDRTLADLL